MSTRSSKMVKKIEESFVKKTRAMMEVPAEERRKARIEKAKSSMPDLVSLYVSVMHLKERELKTSSTGAVFWKEPYVDYNGFLDSLVKMLYDLGDSQTWHPEGKLIFKVDEAINEASIRDEATRAPIVYMKDMPEHLTKIMQRQDPNGSGFFGKMVDAFMRRLLEQSLIEAIRTNLWKDLEDKYLFESVNLGLAKKTRDKSKGKDPIDEFTDFVDLGLPSGTLWAKCNVGASSPEEYGQEFRYYDAMKTKDNIRNVPSDSEFSELIEYCDKEWVKNESAAGMIFTSKINGKKLFLPAAKTSYRPGEEGWYWSRTRSKHDERDSCFLHISTSEFSGLPLINDVKDGRIYNEFNVRLVIEKANESSLGLAKKTREKSEYKDAIDTLSPFVDLGLPSGTLWSKFNLSSTSETDEGEEYTFNDALAAVKAQYNGAVIPDDYDVDELTKYCKYKWTEDGMLFTSKKNGNQILIPKSISAIGEDEWAWIWTSANSIRKTHKWVLCLFNPKSQEATSLKNEPYLDEASIENTFCVRPVIKKSEFDFDTKKA